MFDNVTLFAAIDWPKSIAASLVLSAIATLVNWMFHAASRIGNISETRAQWDREAGVGRNLRAEFEQALKVVLALLAASDAGGEESKVRAIRQICRGLCKTPVSVGEIRHEIRVARSKPPSVKECVREISPSLTDNGKCVLMQAAFVLAASGGALNEIKRSLLVELGLALKIDHRFLPALSKLAAQIGEGFGLPRTCFDGVLNRIETGCPQCGLAFGWDGVRCAHCRYERPSGTTDEEWGRIALRMRRVGGKKALREEPKSAGG